MKTLRSVVVLVLALALSAHVLAADYQAGVDAADRGDYAAALKEWRPLAEQGHAGAQNNLGFMYDHGQGVARDQVKGLMWYNLAAARLPPGEDRDTAVRNRDLVEKQKTPEQIAEAQRLAREWKPK